LNTNGGSPRVISAATWLEDGTGILFGRRWRDLRIRGSEHDGRHRAHLISLDTGEVSRMDQVSSEPFP
jgi:hypothetical protein